MLFENFDPLVLQVKKIVLYWRKKMKSSYGVYAKFPHHTMLTIFFGIFHRIFYFNNGHKNCTYMTFHKGTYLCHRASGRDCYLHGHLACCPNKCSDGVCARSLFFFSCTLYRLVYVGGERINMYKHQRWSFEEKRKCVRGHGAVRNINVLKHTYACSILWMTKCLLCVAKHISCGYDGKLLGNVSSTVSKLAAVKCTWKTKASKFYFFQL